MTLAMSSICEAISCDDLQMCIFIFNLVDYSAEYKSGLINITRNI